MALLELNVMTPDQMSDTMSDQHAWKPHDDTM